MVSSVVRDWNKGRNKAQGVEGKEHKEEPTKKWEKAVKYGVVEKLNGANKEGDGIAREINSNLQKGDEQSFVEQKISSGNAKDGELKRKERKVEEGLAEVDEEVYAKSKEMNAKDKEMNAKDKEKHAKDEEMYAKESEEMYAKESEEMYAMNEEVYAKAKESCFCWPAPSGPSQSKSRQMPKEQKGLPQSKNHLNSLHKAAGGSLESGASCWSDSFSVWGSDFPGTIRSNLGQPDSEGVNLVAIHAYQGGEPGTITLTSGEQLRLVGKEESGWVRVKRLNSEEEGYVPASYTSLPTTTRL